MSRSLTPHLFGRLYRSMKSSALFALVITTAAAQAEVGVVPERLPLDRYAKLKADAPFAVKTAAEEKVEVKIDWADSLYLSGAMKYTENGVEKDWVFLNHKSDPSASFPLYGSEPGKDDIQIVKLDWNPDNPLATQVQLKKGTEFAVIKRDQAPVSMQPPPGAPRPGIPPRPGQPGQPVPTAIPGASGAIRQPTIQPRTPVIPRPSGAAVPQPQAAPGAQQPQGAGAQQQGADRRRIRVINSR